MFLSLIFMSMTTVALIGVGLAMDAVAVSMVSGLAKPKLATGDAFRLALTFGFFQALMPLLGYGIGALAHEWVARIGHWIAFVLLAGIGAKMAWEGLRFQSEEVRGDPFTFRTLLVKGVATSIDALAVGVTIAVMGMPVWISAGTIGLITFALCLPAVWLGAKIGSRWAASAEIIGGVLLIGIGTLTLVQHYIR